MFRHSMLAIGAGSDDGMEVEGEGSSLTTQLLLLYYVLLYQDTMLTKTPGLYFIYIFVFVFPFILTPYS